MSRRQTLNNSSLELLLDTICNLFGGILFISLLVVVLLNLSSEQLVSKPISHSDQANLLRLKRELADTTDKLRRLQQELSRQETLETRMVDPRLETWTEELRGLQLQRTEMAVEKNSVLSGSSDLQKELNDLSQLLSDNRTSRERRDSLELQLRDKQAQRTEVVRPPKERETTKVQIGMVLMDGKLYSYPRRGPQGNLELNEDDFVQTTGLTGTFIEPKPSGGIVVNLEEAISEQVKRRISQFDYKAHYLRVVVWPNSFEHFAHLRKEITAQQFEYSAIPWSSDEDKIPLSAAIPGEEAKVLTDPQ